MLIEIRDSDFFFSDGYDELDDDLIHQIVEADRLSTVPIPPHPFPGVEVIAYCNADLTGLAPNCLVDGHPDVIYGPLVVVALDGDEHRPLTMEEADAYALKDNGEDELPTFYVSPHTSEPTG